MESDYEKLAKAIITLKMCIHCGYQWDLSKIKTVICPKCGNK